MSELGFFSKKSNTSQKARLYLVFLISGYICRILEAEMPFQLTLPVLFFFFCTYFITFSSFSITFLFPISPKFSLIFLIRSSFITILLQITVSLLYYFNCHCSLKGRSQRRNVFPHCKVRFLNPLWIYFKSVIAAINCAQAILSHTSCVHSE